MIDHLYQNLKFYDKMQLLTNHQGIATKLTIIVTEGQKWHRK